MKRIYSILSLVAAAALLAVCLGCETESASSRVTITPGSAEVKLKQAVELVASGGYEYTWQLKHEEWGFLSARTGDRVVYTSVYDPAAAVGLPNDDDAHVQVVTVISTIPGTPDIIDNFAASDHTAGATDPNNANFNEAPETGSAYQLRGLAYITHLFVEKEAVAP